MKTPKSLRRLLEWQASILKPKPELSPSQWGETYRFFDRAASAEPGRMRFDRLPYQRGMIDAGYKPGVRKISFVIASQLGKTEVINTLTGYHIHHDPASIMIVGPSADFCNDWIDGKLDKMIEATPVLRKLVGKIDGKRRAGVRKGAKQYPGGILFAASACSGKDLRGRSCRVVLMDEVDAYPAKIPKEGDPVPLAYKRAANFWNKLIVQSSTPTELETSRICKQYEEGNQQRWYVKCPCCGEEQSLKWSQVKWEENKPETARYECEHCGGHWDDSQRIHAVENGRWVAERPEVVDHESFQLSGLYRIMGHSGNYLEMFVKDYLAARKGGTETYRAWVNTFLAEGYVEEGEVITADPLIKRREDYSLQKVPAGVVRVTCGIDTQPDRWEAELVGWGPGEESWGLGRLVTSSAPGTKQAEKEMDAFLSTRFETPAGDIIELNRAFMDSGGHNQKEVYDYCKDPSRAHLVYPCHGSTRFSAMGLVSKQPRKQAKGVLLYEVYTHNIKNSLYNRIRKEETGPGYMHFPISPQYDADYFAQLTSEKRVKGVWTKPAGVRNEALDCRVYAFAAFISLQILNRRLQDDYEHNLKAAREKEEVEDVKKGLPKPEPKKPAISLDDLKKMTVKAPDEPKPEEKPAEPSKKVEKLPGGASANSKSRWASKQPTRVPRRGGIWGRML